MARFYGSIEGNRGEATRMGTTDSGFHSTCQSWAGSVNVTMYSDDDGTRGRKGFVEHDRVRISVRAGSGYGGTIVYSGDVRELVKKVQAGYELRLVKPRG
jgi:hypothetical protein